MIEQAVRNYILGDPAILAVIRRRVYGARFPEKRALPAITLLIHDDGSESLLAGGVVGLNRATAEVSAWADGLQKNGYLQARKLGDLVRKRLTSKKFQRDGHSVSFTGIESGVAGYDQELNLYRDLVIFNLSYCDV